MTNCKGKYEQYRTFDQCVRGVQTLARGHGGDDDVNSVQCRIRQAEFAESEPFVYCKSAGPAGRRSLRFELHRVLLVDAERRAPRHPPMATWS